ncbi:ABC-ATPase domain-containing protein [Candidatus Contubernalis alkaliaceticus]|uniref:ABC-ATPase domain-containing protein n=1 Tax=Candidatus Contubernalis alkaliaceticus TaxID=338645 RepID=UPI001F4C1294|nr:ABC-ATPase domain-containing protein [Candidatus Contubernalis alkalaceticus]UNC92897.1 ABC-ATPase domain-containing protein [Candidatus Contubernalis alkalaceticus]
MKSKDYLGSTLKRIEGKGYKAYKDIQGSYDFKEFQLYMDYVQGDPFASPSRLRVRVPQKRAQFPKSFFSSRVRRIALEDYLTREFGEAISRVAKRSRGTGMSGIIYIDNCGQEILERTSMVVTMEYVEARISLGLPAQGRRVLAKEAADMFFKEIPLMVKEAMLYENLDSERIRNHVEGNEDQEFLRQELLKRGLVCFVGDGSILPRKSGVIDLPMDRETATPFSSPRELQVEVDLPNVGRVKGMGIPAGITLIVGGGYHGKSTLLRAVERGVYNHIPGDGRERVVALEDAVKIRAEDKRRVEKVNISPFINNLPFLKDTVGFSTEEASGSTSQAANIMESLEMGARLFLLDEDTSATNFMIRDVRMQSLVSRDKEPITPFIDKVKLLKKDLDVSTIMVLGGSGDYFDVADRVIMMDQYQARDVTSKAREITEQYRTERIEEGGGEFGQIIHRIPLKKGLDPTRKGKTKISARGLYSLQFGRQEIDLSLVEQLVQASQTRAIGDIMLFCGHLIDGKKTLREIIEITLQQIEIQGLDLLSPYRGQHPGEYALPRKYEIAAAFNRLRTFHAF